MGRLVNALGRLVNAAGAPVAVARLCHPGQRKDGDDTVPKTVGHPHPPAELVACWPGLDTRLLGIQCALADSLWIRRFLHRCSKPLNLPRTTHPHKSYEAK